MSRHKRLTAPLIEIGNENERFVPDRKKLTKIQKRARLEKLLVEHAEAVREEYDCLHGTDGAAAFDANRKIEALRRDFRELFGV